MKLLTVEVVGTVCIVKDAAGKVVLEVIGDAVHWAGAQDILGNSDKYLVLDYNDNN